MMTKFIAMGAISDKYKTNKVQFKPSQNTNYDLLTKTGLKDSFKCHNFFPDETYPKSCKDNSNGGHFRFYHPKLFKIKVEPLGTTIKMGFFMELPPGGGGGEL